MTTQEKEMIGQLTLEQGIELLATEYKHNGNRFIYHKGSPQRMRAFTNDGELWLTLCEKMVEKGKASIQNIQFFYACNNPVFT